MTSSVHVPYVSIDDVILGDGCDDGCSRMHGGSGPAGPDGFFRFDHYMGRILVRHNGDALTLTEAEYRRRRDALRSGQIGLGL